MKTKIFIGIILSPLYIVGILAAAFWHGYVISQLWAWFVVSAFSVPNISVIHGAGLSLLAQAATGAVSTHVKLDRLINFNEEDDNPAIVTFFSSLILGCFISLVLLAMGWAYTLFL